MSEKNIFYLSPPLKMPIRRCMGRDRILVASVRPHFLSETLTQLETEFEIQRVVSEEAVTFLGKEWVPTFIFVDGDSPLIHSCAKIRLHFPLEKVGLILIVRELNAFIEERGFRGGCDHVMTPPRSRESFLARLHVLKRRLKKPENNVKIEKIEPLIGAGPSLPLAQFELDDLKIYPQDFIVKREGIIVPVSSIQFKLLCLLLSEPEKLLSRKYIKEKVWGDLDLSLRSIDAQISKLRKILPELDPRLINLYGKGYMFTYSWNQVA
ncbi:MAG: winged helix-turn-helix domain-containing protein [Bdellovibrionales bacterium]|nr:winged helix-turn-helix domain-containing protein [Bdellovibrionales bacterium]